ncbi:MAG TPA: putative glycolipid-binding domain-containing protein [Longimicrobium sp.]|nr:putative glycolipid-binding domain-containing protein [Longimicrobium sp.]
MTISVLWQRVDAPGTEHFRLADGPEGARLKGTVLLAQDGAPLHVEYEIECGAGFATRVARVTILAPEPRALELRVDDEWRWWLDGREIESVAGCRDVDLSVTPSTNTLPIRRLVLPVGGTAEVTAAWLRFPEMTIKPLRQRYTRIAERLYRYESPDHSFTAELRVDEHGIVIDYPPAWRRAAPLL